MALTIRRNCFETFVFSKMGSIASPVKNSFRFNLSENVSKTKQLDFLKN